MRFAMLQTCVLCLSTLATYLPAAEPTAKIVKPIAVFSGANSRIDQPSLEVATSADAWDKLWAKHLGTSADDAYRPLAEVDFDRCMVVAILPGNQVNVRGVKIDSITDENNLLRIRFDNVGYQTAGDANNKPPDRPYAFVILPKSDKTIVAEENVQNYKGHPPEWKEWRRAKRP